MLVMHYTASPQWRSLDILTTASSRVSSHYLVADTFAPVFQLVDESKRAWHAGRANWLQETNINSGSIGIENVGWGYTYGGLPPQPPCPVLRRPVEIMVAAERRLCERARAWGLPVPARQWHAFTPVQVEGLVALSQDIVARWGIAKDKVVAHADIAPGRKVDPGPLFPWKALADAGVGDWPSLRHIEAEAGQVQTIGSSVIWMQTKLATWGYEVPENGKLDLATRHVVSAFQMHFRPAQHDGEVDEESMLILQALLAQRSQRTQEQSAVGTVC